MDWRGLSYSTLTAQPEFEVRFFDRGPMPYSGSIQLLTERSTPPNNQHKKITIRIRNAFFLHWTFFDDTLELFGINLCWMSVRTFTWNSSSFARLMLAYKANPLYEGVSWKFNPCKKGLAPWAVAISCLRRWYRHCGDSVIISGLTRTALATHLTHWQLRYW